VFDSGLLLLIFYFGFLVPYFDLIYTSTLYIFIYTYIQVYKTP
jgi:hypothetical protein